MHVNPVPCPEAADMPPSPTSTSPITPESFRAQLAGLTAQLSGRPLDRALQDWLNAEHGAGSALFQALDASCRAGAAAGWLCQHESGGIRHGRIFKPADDLHAFSVDVVDMTDIAGPHHVHPEGEIDLVLPVEGEPRFDGQPAGWLVCPPGSAHRPTVTGGRARVLYLLPQGAIHFTR
jgi:hypothetical protein